MKGIGRRIWLGSSDGRGVFGIGLSAFAVAWALAGGFSAMWVAAASTLFLTAAGIWRRGSDRAEDEKLRREYEWCQTMEFPYGLPGRERPDATPQQQDAAVTPQSRRRGE